LSAKPGKGGQLKPDFAHIQLGSNLGNTGFVLLFYQSEICNRQKEAGTAQLLFFNVYSEFRIKIFNFE